ncbi:MAG: 50S ribosomal protein L17 [Candidatus Portnoybacteria bacterium CG23_combo_of_CG06-09_8_20_14_all_37_13]|uniref:50S ribosomal protein L17 n=1 Tax=Candidatus Portnoybacteria bacterium CG23_combo_of_CG06-09_8_20_14_all_37_13 TaxID=1974819 RepID=A0A2G9YFB4_9BACT|nr:MAG: 50S ribosomal protein L17 [Candidatus Portnoybacteria bacterium CG23_combo_of_CG06-09_8_20_14_all_37_13]
MRKFSRKRDPRKALLRGLAESLILHEKIKTTEAKTKELRPYIEKLITKAKKNTLASRRALLKLFDNNIVRKLEEISRKYLDRQGGYTRIIKLALRGTDAAKMARIEFV